MRDSEHDCIVLKRTLVVFWDLPAGHDTMQATNQQSWHGQSIFEHAVYGPRTEHDLSCFMCLKADVMHIAMPGLSLLEASEWL